MFDDLDQLQLFPVTAADVLVNLAVALLCGVFIAWLYRRTYRGPGYSVNFGNSIVLLAMITSIVIMVIGNSLARAFGLVGAMSIIRFRTAVKETRDIVFIFFGLAIGMAAGVGYHRIAFVGTAAIGLMLYLFSKSRVTAPNQNEYLLQFSYSANGDASPAYAPILHKFCRRHKVINVKSGCRQDSLELAYYVRFRDDRRSSDFVRELSDIHGVTAINLFFDEEQV